MYRRKPAVAGAFYPGNEKDLREAVNSCLNSAEDIRLDGDLLGIISPHAGYIYSGPVAAYSYIQLKKASPDVVIVIAPSHMARFNGAAVIPEGVYDTPLGSAEIDGVIGGKLLEHNGFGIIEQVHKSEHSLEVQVPFIQTVLDNFTLVPVIIGSVDLDVCSMIADGFAEVLKSEKRRYCIVISTDLSHYYSYENAVSIDKKFIESLLSFDENELKNSISAGKAEACGEGPLLTGLMLAKRLGAKGIQLLKYANSGDTSGSRDQVVGYLSAAIVK